MVIVKNTVIDPMMYITKVRGEGIRRSEYEKEIARARHFFVWAKQEDAQLASLEKDVLGRLIDMKIITQYARKNKIKVDNKDVEKYYQALMGKKSEAEYLALMQEMYGGEKKDYMRKLSDEMLKENVQKHLQKPLAPWLAEMKK